MNRTNQTILWLTMHASLVLMLLLVGPTVSVDIDHIHYFALGVNLLGVILNIYLLIKNNLKS